MGAVLGWLGTAFGRLMVDRVLAWVAFKGVMVILFTVIMPIILNNFIYDTMETIMNYTNDSLGSTQSIAGGMTFTGLMAWFISVFRIPECVSVIVNAMVLRVTLAMVPFGLGLK